MNGFALRSKYLLLGWGTVGIIYSLCDHLQGQGHTLTPLPIDGWIPFSPAAVWLYLSFFLLIPAGYFFTPRARLPWLARSMQLSALGAGAVYLLWPTTLLYPSFTGSGLSSQLLNGLIAVDSSQNCFPSLHAALTILAVWAIARKGKILVTVASALWALAIAFSILQLRRHLFIDIVGGALLAGVCGWLAAYLEIRGKHNKEIVYE